MTECILIVALIAIAAIAVYQYLGNTVRPSGRACGRRVRDRRPGVPARRRG